jgi:hypothetical protein
VTATTPRSGRFELLAHRRRAHYQSLCPLRPHRTFLEGCEDHSKPQHNPDYGPDAPASRCAPPFYAPRERSAPAAEVPGELNVLVERVEVSTREG